MEIRCVSAILYMKVYVCACSVFCVRAKARHLQYFNNYSIPERFLL